MAGGEIDAPQAIQGIALSRLVAPRAGPPAEMAEAEARSQDAPFGLGLGLGLGPGRGLFSAAHAAVARARAATNEIVFMVLLTASFG